MIIGSGDERVIAALDDGVLAITLNRPDARNALDHAMMMAIARLAALADEDERVRAVMLAGAGGDFCAGDTPDDMGPWPESLRHRWVEGGHGAAPIVAQHMIRAVRAIAKPVAAVLTGEVAGIGLDLAAVCDFRLADDAARLGDPRIRQGRHGASGLTYTLPRLIGQSRATWILLTGEAVSAAEAHRFGLVHRLVPADELVSAAKAFGRELAALPTRAVAVRKEMLLAQLDLPFEAAMVHCLGVRQTNIIEDTAEGLAAWRERRPPRFTGR